MITAILLVIGFLITGGAFGAQIIGAFDLVQYWLWFGAGLATILAVIFAVGGGLVGGMAADDHKLNKLGVGLGVFGGSLIGTILAGVIVCFAYVQLWLSYYIVENTPVSANAFSDLPTNTQYAIIGFFVIWFVSFIKTPKSSK